MDETLQPDVTERRFSRRLIHVVVVAAVALAGSLISNPPERAVAQEICTIANGCVPPETFPIPEILYLEQGGQYFADAAQTASLRALENVAVETVLDFHNLPASQADAVRTWGRESVLGQLYLLLAEAIDTDAASRTTDQQNAVDWLQDVAQRRNIDSAATAAREYVKWAGLNRLVFDNLMRTGPTEAQLLAFLSGPVINYDLPPPDATEGWCAYRSPAPYESEYQGFNNPVCSGPFIGFVLPPTPSYDQFVKWGAAKANYQFLSSGAYLGQAQRLGAGLGFSVPMSVVVSSAATYVAATRIVAGTARLALAATRLTGVVVQGVSFGAAVASLVVASISLALVIIAAIATAILVGIDVANAAALPGKLASLVASAQTTPPDVSTLVASTDSSLSLASIFVGVTAPAPNLRTCDNSRTLPPGVYEFIFVGNDNVTLSASEPCLNPTPLPDPTDTDPVWLVTRQGTSTTTAPSTISIKTASGSASVRLSDRWFIRSEGGSTTQALRLEYTDWEGDTQYAWMIADGQGYSFLTYAPPAEGETVDIDTCVTEGTCGIGSTLQYLGGDGAKYTAAVRLFQPATGNPVIDPPVQGSPTNFDANGFAPGGATAPVSYQWAIAPVFCGFLTCDPIATLTGENTSYTFSLPADYEVTLTATDALGVTEVRTFRISVTPAPPTLSFLSTCAGTTTTNCSRLNVSLGTSIALRGNVTYTGANDNLRVTMNWGDGIVENLDLNPSGFRFPGDSPIQFTKVAGQQAYTVVAPHNYTAAGIYRGSMRIANIAGFGTDGPSVSVPFTATVIGPQTISFTTPTGRTYGEVFTITATGGASGQPVTFTAVGACSLSNATTGSVTATATVTMTAVGSCDITARQPAGGAYTAAEVTRRFVAFTAVLDVQASSETITYGEAFPTITPSYSGFRFDDTQAVVTTPATCSIDASAGPAGVYATNCSGAFANRYTFNYLPGTLSIRRAVLTGTVADATMVRGESVPQFTVSYSGFIGDDDASVVSGGICSAIDNEGGEVTSDTPTGVYPISCVGGSAANYTIDYVAGRLTIRNPGDATIPDAPSELGGSPLNGTVFLAWLDNSSNETGFRIQRARWNGSQFVEWASFEAPANSEGFSQQVVDGRYAYLVSSFNEAGESAAAVTVVDTSTASGPPAAPQNVAASSTPAAVEVTWDDSSSDEFGFEILRARLVGGAWSDWRSFVVDRDVESFVDPDPIDGDYSYLVRSYHSLGVSDWAITTLTRSTATAVPAAPGAPTATVDVDDVTVSWVDSSTDELRFELARARYNPTTGLWGEWAYFSSDLDTTSFVDTAVPDGQYAYAVRAVNPLGVSAWEFTDLVLVSDPFLLPAAAANVRITPQSPGLLVEWDDVADNEVTYEVMRAEFDGSQWTGWTSWPLDKDSTSFADEAPPAGTLAYLVRTSNAVGRSDWALNVYTPISG